MASKLHEDKRYIIVGKPKIDYGKITFSHPDVIETEAPEEPVTRDEEIETRNLEQGPRNKVPITTSQVPEVYNSGRIFPIYPELMGIRPGWFAQKMR